MNEWQLARIRRYGLNGEIARLIALLDTMKQPPELESLQMHFKEALQAIRDIKTRLEMKRFRIAVAGEATGKSSPFVKRATRPDQASDLYTCSPEIKSQC